LKWRREKKIKADSETNIKKKIEDAKAKVGVVEDRDKQSAILRQQFRELDEKEARVGDDEWLMCQSARPRIATVTREQQLKHLRRGYLEGDIVALRLPGAKAQDKNIPASKQLQVILEKSIGNSTCFHTRELGASSSLEWKNMSRDENFQDHNPPLGWMAIGKFQTDAMSFDGQGVRPAISLSKGWDLKLNVGTSTVTPFKYDVRIENAKEDDVEHDGLGGGKNGHKVTSVDE